MLGILILTRACLHKMSNNNTIRSVLMTVIYGNHDTHESLFRQSPVRLCVVPLCLRPMPAWWAAALPESLLPAGTVLGCKPSGFGRASFGACSMGLKEFSPKPAGVA